MSTEAELVLIENDWMDFLGGHIAVVQPHPDLAKWRRFALAPGRVRRRRWADPFETDMPGADEIRAALAKAATAEEVRGILDRRQPLDESRQVNISRHTDGDDGDEPQPDDDFSGILNRWWRGGDSLTISRPAVRKDGYVEEEHPRGPDGKWIAEAGPIAPTKAIGTPRGTFEERIAASQARLRAAGLDEATARSATDAVSRYTHHSSDVNTALSTGAPLSAEQAAVVDGLKAYMSATQPTTRETYRGAGFKTSDAVLMQPGADITTDSFWSTSTSEKIAKQFAIPMVGESFDPEHRITRLVVTIESPHSGVPIAEASGKPAEREVLFAPGTRFKVIAREGNKVRVREVGASGARRNVKKALAVDLVLIDGIMKNWEDQPRDERGRFADASGGAAVAGGDRFQRPGGVWDQLRSAGRLRTEAMAHRREGREWEARLSEEAAAGYEQTAATALANAAAPQPAQTPDPEKYKWDKTPRYERSSVIYDEEKTTRAAEAIFGVGNLPTVASLERTWGDAASGLEVRLGSVSGSEGYNGTRLSCSGTLHADGRRVGTIDRTFIKHADGSVEVHHDYFVINDDGGGPPPLRKGAGEAMMRQSVEAYTEAGVDKVTVNPAWLGQYVWGAFGYDVPTHGLEAMKTRFRSYLKDKGYSDDRADRATSRIKHMWDLADYDDGTRHEALVSTGPGVEKTVKDMHTGKAFLLQTQWTAMGTLDLKDKSSPSYRRAKKRLKLRG